MPFHKTGDAPKTGKPMPVKKSSEEKKTQPQKKEK
jgi:hypothetical protein